MAPRAGTRSQKAPGASQTQYGGTQRGGGRSQRAGPSQTQRAASDDDEEEEEDDDEQAQSQAMDVDGDDEVKRRANDLVRLALFTEQKRIHLRREDITKKVLAPHTKLFNRVYAAAQKILRETFGLELAELPNRAWLEQDDGDAGAGPSRGAATQAQDEELAEACRATGIKKKAAASGSKTYILRSCLHPTLIEMAAQTDNALLTQELNDLPDNNDNESVAIDEDDEERKPTSHGSIISWSHNDQLGSLGILYVILALILVNGRVLSDVDLRSYLKHLHLPNTSTRSPVHLTSISPIHSLSTDAFLTQLIKQNYLERRVVGDTALPGRPGKRGRTQTQRRDDDDEGVREMYEWRWGTRAMCEVSEEAIARFVAEFMVGGEEGEGDEAGDVDVDEALGGPSNRRRGGGDRQNGERSQRQTKEDKVKMMITGIEKAAGGSLAHLK